MLVPHCVHQNICGCICTYNKFVLEVIVYFIQIKLWNNIGPKWSKPTECSREYCNKYIGLNNVRVYFQRNFTTFKILPLDAILHSLLWTGFDKFYHENGSASFPPSWSCILSRLWDGIDFEGFRMCFNSLFPLKSIHLQQFVTGDEAQQVDC